MNEEEYAYVIARWVPPWIDGGKALKQIIDTAVENNLQFNSWLLICLFLGKQLELDMQRVQKQHLNIGP